MIKKMVITIIAFGLLLLFIKRKDMTIKQSLLKTFYPALMQMGKWFGSQKSGLHNANMTLPQVSFYSLSATGIDGKKFDFATLKGKKVMIVNTASDCGYTAQLADLEKLHIQYQKSLVILAFPANDFKNQETGDNTEIEAFCKKNYGVSFSIMAKSIVIKGEGQNPVYHWLTDKRINGWNDHAPDWNFSKYLINEEGVLMHYFSPGISPLDKVVTSKL